MTKVGSLFLLVLILAAVLWTRAEAGPAHRAAGGAGALRHCGGAGSFAALVGGGRQCGWLIARRQAAAHWVA